MTIQVDGQVPLAGELTSRRGLIISTETNGVTVAIEAQVSLPETFGDSMDLRSITYGQGMSGREFARYRRALAS